MTHDNIVAENGLFDFEAFKKEAAKRMKAGQPLTGESGILTPLIKKIVEASPDAEIEQHMEDCDETGVANRRKRQTILNESLDNKVLGLFGLGLYCR